MASDNLPILEIIEDRPLVVEVANDTIRGADGADGQDGGLVNSWYGPWDPNTYYSPYNLVSYQGSVWLSTTDVNHGNVPGDDMNWQLFASKGDQGDPGADGSGGGGGGTAASTTFDPTNSASLAGKTNVQTAVDELATLLADIGTPTSFEGVWDSGTAYTTGQLVSYGNGLWAAATGSTNVAPDSVVGTSLGGLDYPFVDLEANMGAPFSAPFQVSVTTHVYGLRVQANIPNPFPDGTLIGIASDWNGSSTVPWLAYGETTGVTELGVDVWFTAGGSPSTVATLDPGTTYRVVDTSGLTLVDANPTTSGVVNGFAGNVYYGTDYSFNIQFWMEFALLDESQNTDWTLVVPPPTNGTDGTDGTDGADGANGTDGVDGTNGTNGTNGLDGSGLTIEQTTYTQQGPVALATGASRWYLENDCTFESIAAAVGTAPVGADLEIDVLYNGTSIFSAAPAIADGTNYTNTATVSTSSYTAGGYFTVNVTQIGSSTAGSDLTVTLRLVRT